MYKYSLFFHDWEDHGEFTVYHEKLFTKDEVLTMIAEIVVKFKKAIDSADTIPEEYPYSTFTDSVFNALDHMLVSDYGFIIPVEAKPDVEVVLDGGAELGNPDDELFNGQKGRGNSFNYDTNFILKKVKELL